MKKRIWIPMLMMVTALLFTGCAMRTVEEMYALPKRSEEFNEMQSAIDTAMYGMTYASPQSGENQQTVQMADLDGDGKEESIRVFHTPQSMDAAFMVVSKADGTAILREAIYHFDYSQCYLPDSRLHRLCTNQEHG